MKEIPAFESRRVRTQPRIVTAVSFGARPASTSRMESSFFIVYTHRGGKGRDRMGNESQSVYARALRRAADILGGKDVLRAALHVPMHSIEEWLNGRSEPPTDVFLKAVDILSTPTGSAPATAATLRARSLSRASGELIRNAERTVAHSRALSDAHHSAVAQQKLLAGFLVATFGAHQRIAMLDSALGS